MERPGSSRGQTGKHLDPHAHRFTETTPASATSRTDFPGKTCREGALGGLKFSSRRW
jgi:hypothetical protein